MGRGRPYGAEMGCWSRCTVGRHRAREAAWFPCGEIREKMYRTDFYRLRDSSSESPVTLLRISRMGDIFLGKVAWGDAVDDDS